MNEVLREFLLETHESLAQIDLDLVALEKDPNERERLARTFRTVHTVKGTAGFLGFRKLQAVGHSSESLLSLLRAGELVFNAEIATTLLGVVDAIRSMLGSIEQTEGEGDGDYSALIQNLERLITTGSLETPPRGGIPPRAISPPPSEPAESQVNVQAPPVAARPPSSSSNRDPAPSHRRASTYQPAPGTSSGFSKRAAERRAAADPG